jgi:hypothetical protein
MREKAISFSRHAHGWLDILLGFLAMQYYVVIQSFTG